MRSKLTGRRTTAAGFALGLTLGIVFGVDLSEERTLPRGALVERVLDEVERSHVQDVDVDALLYEGLDDMLQQLDRHSRYFSPEKVSDFQQETDGFIVGIGIVVGAGDPESEGEAALPRVTGVVDGGPASRAGLLAGDRLVRVSGKSLDAQTVPFATSLIKGPEGTEVTLEVVTPGQEPREIRVPRQRVSIPSIGEVALYRETGGAPVGLVRLLQFQPNSTDEVKTAIEGLLEAGAESVILDLRHNGGGFLREAIGIASLFLEGEPVVVRTVGRMITRPGESPRVIEERSPASGSPAFPDLPIAILIDDNSASASEIVAGCLRDHRRAPLIGVESFGKWTVQNVIPLGADAQHGIVKLTTQSFHPPVGGRIRRSEEGDEGLVPDIPVAVDPDWIPVLLGSWNSRQLDRINGPWAVSELTPPSATIPEEVDGPIEFPADPILARAIDLLSRPEAVSELFGEDQLTPPLEEIPEKDQASAASEIPNPGTSSSDAEFENSSTDGSEPDRGDDNRKNRTP